MATITAPDRRGGDAPNRSSGPMAPSVDDVVGADDVVSVDDEALVAEALAAEPATTAADDAVSYWDVVAPRPMGILPDWYMPSPSAGSRRLRGWRRQVVYLVVASIALINAAGLCITYGYVTLG